MPFNTVLVESSSTDVSRETFNSTQPDVSRETLPYPKVLAAQGFTGVPYVRLGLQY